MKTKRNTVAIFAVFFAAVLCMNTNTYADEINQFARYKNYIAENDQRYEEFYKNHQTLTLGQIVTCVNIGIDYPFYGNVKDIEITEATETNYLLLCNKYNKLPDDYVPSAYSKSDMRVLRLLDEPQARFDEMRKAAKESGLSLSIVSAYRSYLIQQSLYEQNKVKSPNSVEKYFARPAFSEHQTGLACDINTTSVSARFENKNEYKWLMENAHNYGFILRYPEGKTWLTGYNFEPWHWRYVGVEAATVIREQGLTLEEFIAMGNID